MNQKIIPIFFVIALTACTSGNSDDLLLNQMAVLEGQIQNTNLMQLERGNGFWMDVIEEYNTTPKNPENMLKLSKVKYIMDKMELINKETASIIALTEKYKVDLLKDAGENLREGKQMNSAVIVWRKYDSKEGFLPSSLNLSALKNKDHVANYFVESNGKPNERGMELWNALQKFRANLVSATGSYEAGTRTFEIHPSAINRFSSRQDLIKKVDKMVQGSKANLKEEGQMLIDLYVALTKLEWNNQNEHWISTNFKDSPLVNVLATLSSLQNDVLSARTMALVHIKSKFGSCYYGFSAIIPIANGPAFAKVGDEVQIKVLIAAFDDYNKPLVTVEDAGSTVAVEGGVGLVTVKPKNGTNTYRGKITIKNKSGIAKTEDWEWTIYGK